MAKKEKYPKDYISFDINLARAKELHLTPRQISNTSKYYKSLTIHTIKKKAIDYNLISLRGQKGEVAYVRNDSYYRHRKITLITELSLSLLAEEQRKWIALASKFFKPQFISDSEIVSRENDFIRIKNKPYSTFKSTVYSKRNRKLEESYNLKMRLKKYSDSKPWGSITNVRERIKLRNKRMRQEFNHYKKQGASLEKCLFQVKRWLASQAIWEGRKGHKSLSKKMIMKICYSKE